MTVRAFVSFVTFVSFATAQRAARLHDLTMPPTRLPASCALAQAKSGLVGLGLPTNPWIGTDASIIASIRERIDQPPLLPDGPPMSSKEAARFRFEFAKGVDEAYAAVYEDAESKRLIPVYGLKLAASEKPLSPMRGTQNNPRIVRVSFGSIVSVATGDGECFQEVAAYLKSLSQ